MAVDVNAILKQLYIIDDMLFPSKNRIGGLVVKLAVAKPHSSVSASPGFDSRPMQAFFLWLAHP